MMWWSITVDRVLEAFSTDGPLEEESMFVAGCIEFFVALPCNSCTVVSEQREQKPQKLAHLFSVVEFEEVNCKLENVRA